MAKAMPPLGLFKWSSSANIFRALRPKSFLAARNTISLRVSVRPKSSAKRPLTVPRPRAMVPPLIPFFLAMLTTLLPRPKSTITQSSSYSCSPDLVCCIHLNSLLPRLHPEDRAQGQEGDNPRHGHKGDHAQPVPEKVRPLKGPRGSLGEGQDEGGGQGPRGHAARIKADAHKKLGDKTGQNQGG